MTETKKEYWLYPFFLLISFFFLIILSSRTSPLFNEAGGDSGIFLMLGRMLLAGKTPYVDFFDHKGPVIIFIEAIGLSLSSDERTGIFILQTINLTITSILVYKCSRYMLPILSSITVVFLSLFIFSFTIQGGNLTEEYSLPFLMLSLLFAFKYNFTLDIKKWQLFILGISAAILFWLRLTNMGILCASGIFLLAFAIKNKQKKDIINIISFPFLGFFVISALICIYFIYIKAFDEMIYATFTFNFKYIKSASLEIDDTLSAKTLDIIKKWVSISILLLGVGVYYYKKRKLDGIIMLSFFYLVFSFIIFSIGPGYYHYMTLLIPVATFGFILILHANVISKTKNKNRQIFFCLFSLIILFGYLINKYNDQYYQDTQDATVLINKVKKITEIIPEEDQHSIYTYNTFPPAAFWIYSGLLPQHKYFILQEYHGKYDPNIITEINNMMKNDSPLWLITKSRENSYNHDFWEIVDKKYILINSDTEDNLYLYKIKAKK